MEQSIESTICHESCQLTAAVSATDKKTQLFRQSFSDWSETAAEFLPLHALAM